MKPRDRTLNSRDIILPLLFGAGRIFGETVARVTAPAAETPVPKNKNKTPIKYTRKKVFAIGWQLDGNVRDKQEKDITARIEREKKDMVKKIQR